MNYTYVKEHQSINMTPAQKAGIEAGNVWNEPIEGAIKQETKEQVIRKRRRLLLR